MDPQLPDISRLRPAGGRRSSKRDRILSVFLRQKGHVSADDLFDQVRREEAGIGRATVYRTLQWMVDADIARKVDFGEGRSRFEPAYRSEGFRPVIAVAADQRQPAAVVDDGDQAVTVMLDLV